MRILDVLAVSCVGLLLVLMLCVELTDGPMLWPVKRRFVSMSAWQLTPHGRDQGHSIEHSMKFTVPKIMKETALVVLFTPHERDQELEFEQSEFSSASDLDGHRDGCSCHST